MSHLKCIVQPEKGGLRMVPSTMFTSLTINDVFIFVLKGPGSLNCKKPVAVFSSSKEGGISFDVTLATNLVFII